MEIKSNAVTIWRDTRIKVYFTLTSGWGANTSKVDVDSWLESHELNAYAQSVRQIRFRLGAHTFFSLPFLTALSHPARFFLLRTRTLPRRPRPSTSPIYPPARRDRNRHGRGTMDPNRATEPHALDYLLGAGSAQTDSSASHSAAPLSADGDGAGASTSSAGARGGARRGAANDGSGNRVLRNRAMARVSNAKRKGRIKEMESGLEKTRLKVEELQESIRSLEAENNDLRSLLKPDP